METSLIAIIFFVVFAVFIFASSGYKLIDDDIKHNINNINELKDIIDKELIIELNISNNQLTQLPECINDFINLQILYCYRNNLTTLGKLNLLNLQILYCYRNKLTTLGKLNLPNLQKLYCYNNELTTLPLWLMNTRLNYIRYENNEIDNLPIQLLRFINRIRNVNINNLNVYNDNQNVHNSNIQLSVKDSINRLTTRTDLPKYNKEELIKYILDDTVINCKEQLIEYINDDSEHSLLLLTFSEVLWYVLMTIIQDFNEETQNEIKGVLNDDMADAECKCFTGRMSRVINCLSGFSDLVSIQIKGTEQIGNVIIMIKQQLKDADNYSVELHKEMVIKQLKELGYTNEEYEEWIEYI